MQPVLSVISSLLAPGGLGGTDATARVAGSRKDDVATLVPPKHELLVFDIAFLVSIAPRTFNSCTHDL